MEMQCLSDHGHPLKLLEKTIDDDDDDDDDSGSSICFKCCDKCLDDQVYGCEACGYYIHQSCSEIPREVVNHAFHSDHTLKLYSQQPGTDPAECVACCRKYDKLSYKCLQCPSVEFDVECISLNPTIQFDAHSHPLTLFKNISPNLRCDYCQLHCDSSYIFRCIGCHYNLHLLCGPLPCIIKADCHSDPLKLMEYFVEDGYEDDNVYCDACEQVRNPDECVYYCKDCSFTVEFKCVINEVLRSLSGGCGNVKLRTAVVAKLVGGRVISNVSADDTEFITESVEEIEDISTKYTELKVVCEYIPTSDYTSEEKDCVMQLFKKAGVDLSDGESENGETLKQVAYSEDDFKILMEMLDSYYKDENLKDMLVTVSDEIVQIGELMVVQNYASILKGLLHTYGDFTTKSNLGSERLKMNFLTMFCKVIYGMGTTTVRDVNETLLRKWWKMLKVVQNAGFEIQFAIDRLYKVVQAFFGLKAKASFAQIKSHLDTVSHELQQLEAQLEAKKRYYNAIESDYNRCRKSVLYERSPLVDECFNIASEFKWKRVWDVSPVVVTFSDCDRYWPAELSAEALELIASEGFQV